HLHTSQSRSFPTRRSSDLAVGREQSSDHEEGRDHDRREEHQDDREHDADGDLKEPDQQGPAKPLEEQPVGSDDRGSGPQLLEDEDRKSTRLNSSHGSISYA